MSESDSNVEAGISRRSLIKRSAIVGGTVMWASPVIQSLTSPAGAASQACSCDTCVEFKIALPVGPPLVFSANCTLTPNACACACCCVGVSDKCSNCSAGPAGACSVPPAFTSCGAFAPGPCP